MGTVDCRTAGGTVLTSSGLLALVYKRADKYNSKVVLASGEVLAFLEANTTKIS